MHNYLISSSANSFFLYTQKITCDRLVDCDQLVGLPCSNLLMGEIMTLVEKGKPSLSCEGLYSLIDI